MDNRSGRWLWGRVDVQGGALAKMSAFLPSVYAWIPKIIQNWGGRQKLALEIHKSLCGVRKKDNLIDSTCFI